MTGKKLGSGRQLLVDELRQLGFAEGAHLGGRQLTILEKHQRGDAADAKFGGNVSVFIHVHFGDLKLAIVGAGSFIQDGGDHFAGTTPFSPKINQYRLLRIQNSGFESCSGNMLDEIACHEESLVLGQSKGN